MFKYASGTSVLLKTHTIPLKEVREFMDKIKNYRWNRFLKAKIQNLAPLGRIELHMLWWGDTPVGNRKVTSLYMKTACNLAKENVFALRIIHLCQIHKLWLGCFTIKSSKDVLQNHCLQTRKQTHCRKYIFTEEIFFTFFSLWEIFH